VPRKQRRYRRLAIGSVLTIILALIIAVLTLAKMPSVGPSGSDKFFHALAFASLAFPLALVRPRLAIWVFLGVIAYGASIELIQPHFGRQAEWADLVADGIGAAVGAIAARYLGYRLRQSRWKDSTRDVVTDP
jgi:VanZ family protein